MSQHKKVAGFLRKSLHFRDHEFGGQQMERVWSRGDHQKPSKNGQDEPKFNHKHKVMHFSKHDTITERCQKLKSYKTGNYTRTEHSHMDPRNHHMSCLSHGTTYISATMGFLRRKGFWERNFSHILRALCSAFCSQWKNCSRPTPAQNTVISRDKTELLS